MALNLFLVALLIGLTAFFVATEFAIIRLRSSRVDQLVLEGRKNALAVRKVTSNLDAYLSACQLGITITALGLGWLGEPTVEKMLHPLFHDFGVPESVSTPVSFVLAFVLITFLHVVVGELAPKSLAIQKAEQVSFWFALPIIWFHRVMYPFIWLLNGSANRLIRLFGLKPASENEEAHSEEEIRIILNDSFESGKINNTEYGYVSRIFTFDELSAREIMVPRTDMACLYMENSLQENIEIIWKEQYTRFPVAQGSKDNIVGFINTKKLFMQYRGNPDFDWKSVIQPALTVSDATPVKSLLKTMQAARVHIAILVDEYGGTSGLITIEDILEEIVGEIRDEFDADERKEIEMIAESQHYIVDGTVLLSEVNALLGTDLDSEDVDTIGGWVYSASPDIEKGESLSFGGLDIVVLEKEKHRVRKVEIKLAAERSAAVAAPAES
ncbi:HlyC/CorC family transporter [Paenibacillus antri]|uniref:HlyC/CorC family transporter n=1 Tax=Paenibacillus antri TaxID=2582848 RepID=A0A5R9G370_9BACL|nr:hemolysin family protein [Paenibacillus antri]TLS48560.1 HlyC/CorC family transporter [Paenibacillus antri]